MSQNASITAVKARILAIAALCTGITTVVETVGEKWTAWETAQLSAVIVRYGGTTARVKATLGLGSAGGKARVTRNFEVIRYVARLPKGSSAAQQKAAIEAAEAVADVLPNHFLNYPALALSDTGIVFEALPMTDSGAVISPYADVPYSALVYTLPVITYTP